MALSRLSPSIPSDASIKIHIWSVPMVDYRACRVISDDCRVGRIPSEADSYFILIVLYPTAED